MPKKSKRKKETEVVGLLGVGLDNKDGHHRFTWGDNFVLVGGSDVTHEKMQDVAIHFNEKLHKRGKQLPDLSLEELRDLFDACDGRESLD